MFLNIDNHVINSNQIIKVWVKGSEVNILTSEPVGDIPTNNSHFNGSIHGRIFRIGCDSKENAQARFEKILDVLEAVEV